MAWTSFFLLSCPHCVYCYWWNINRKMRFISLKCFSAIVVATERTNDPLALQSKCSRHCTLGTGLCCQTGFRSRVRVWPVFKLWLSAGKLIDSWAGIDKHCVWECSVLLQWNTSHCNPACALIFIFMNAGGGSISHFRFRSFILCDRSESHEYFLRLQLIFL